MNRTLLTLALALIALPAQSFIGVASKKKKATSSETFVTIGTGEVNGVYFPTGGAIARLLSGQQDKHGLRGVVEATPGSVYNIDQILSKKLTFAIVQSDQQYEAAFGLGHWRAKGPQMDLRAVFSLHPEAVTLIADARSGIKEFADLKGKRVGIGDLGSGPHGNALHALRAAGLYGNGAVIIHEIPASVSQRKLQEKKLDAFFYTAGHPNALIAVASGGRRAVRFIEIPFADRLIAKHPYYRKANVPVLPYPRVKNSKDVATFGVTATLVTSKETPDDVVYELTKAVFENLDELRSQHPSLAAVTLEHMLSCNTAPFHSGAIRYFKEAGLLEALEAASYAKKEEKKEK